jgi:drug/metabolite transporter (DMT)-like permease
MEESEAQGASLSSSRSRQQLLRRRRGRAVLAFFVLLCVQVGVALLYKLSQNKAGRYNYSPLSAMCIAELIKCALATTLFLLSLRREVRAARSRASIQAQTPAATDEDGGELPDAEIDTEKAALTGTNSASNSNNSSSSNSSIGSTNGDGSSSVAAASANSSPSPDAGSAEESSEEQLAVLLAGESVLQFIRFALRQFRTQLLPSGCCGTGGDGSSGGCCPSVLLLHLASLAALYFALNQLQYFVLTLVDTGTEALFHSTTTIVAAVLLWSAFGRTIRPKQWAALLMQIAGVMVVFWEPGTDDDDHEQQQQQKEQEPQQQKPVLSHSRLVVALLLLSVTISASCSVWNEYVVKRFAAGAATGANDANNRADRGETRSSNSMTALMAQNCVLYALGSTFNLLFFLVGPDLYARTSAGSSSESSAHHPGFFEGYSAMALLLVLANSCLGLVISAVYKYADALVKTFASACATAALFLLNAAFFSVPLRLHVFAGVLAVFLASATYFHVAAKPPTTTATTADTQRQQQELEGAPTQTPPPHHSEETSSLTAAASIAETDVETSSLSSDSTATAGSDSTDDQQSSAESATSVDDMRFVCFERQQRTRLIIVVCGVVCAVVVISLLLLQTPSVQQNGADGAISAVLAAWGSNNTAESSSTAAALDSSTAAAPP